MSLIQPLPSGPLDIVGDVHGEYDALLSLLAQLGYDQEGRHPAQRQLVFVGDFCDRGPDSPAVLALARRLVQGGRALAVAGNHEINLLREDPKDGSGWFFDSRTASDQPKYAPFAQPQDEAERQAITEFAAGLPVALEREDLRIVHAAWVEPQIRAVRAMPLGSLRAQYDHWEAVAETQAGAGELRARRAAEALAWPHSLEDARERPPFLPAHSESELNKAVFNPLKVLTTGLERRCTEPFYAGGKWRFVERMAWWNDYHDAPAVVIGHYWRRLHPPRVPVHGKQEENLFGQTPPLSWHGPRGNVFCVDYSVGGRWVARLAGEARDERFNLAALRWPERTLMFEDGREVPTQDFGG
ncbi:metallophosphoesterase [Comamonas endophytica]|uniref:Metallophosphoesterase n=1 Tax=Comamonas endophytica TaxID=2949090 RepID=A0ABY6GAY3_9BURK|nr:MULTISPECIES: metallophosphoesterase [unclassified Acidovorax]MCD2513749.1 metallophosphoesterase [Acidovorax sp. D4N7]UYG52246.1 metallophosphoesterase [Acidovorax sp. 5MLIR]